MNQLDLKNRHAVITGGASGIGLAIAQRMLTSGARLTLWDMNEDALRHSDVAHAAVLSEQHGPVDILVNSAGITGPNVSMADYPIADWQRVFDINMHGLFYCCRELSPFMRQRNYGRIVNIASVAGKEGNPNASAYSASKAGVIALTKSLGKELATTGVRVNCVTPAAVKTAMFDQMTPAHIDFMLSKIPMARFGETHEIAAMVAWLCTEDCSFSTGAVFDLSGGRATY
jgi:2-dehydro-3-deoxy-L-rhamnonate dehydrogenase (NAD+)